MNRLVLIYCVLVAIISEQSTCMPEARSVSVGYGSVGSVELSELSKEQLMGQFDPLADSNYVLVEAPYTTRGGMLLRKEVYEAFKLMWAAAKRDGISLNIISSTRNFVQQKKIWEGKWERYSKETPDPRLRALRILEFSSMPGTSRHHWGTDLDINDLNDESFVGKGVHRKVYEWMTKNASNFGFGQPYTAKGPDRPNGYSEEKWHWSYLPLAIEYKKMYSKKVNEGDIRGFEGSGTAGVIGVISNYVMGVSAACQ